MKAYWVHLRSSPGSDFAIYLEGETLTEVVLRAAGNPATKMHGLMGCLPEFVSTSAGGGRETLRYRPNPERPVFVPWHAVARISPVNRGDGEYMP